LPIKPATRGSDAARMGNKLVILLSFCADCLKLILV
jgi:hypothetical protein